jgi:hypothetical protein
MSLMHVSDAVGLWQSTYRTSSSGQIAINVLELIDFIPTGFRIAVFLMSAKPCPVCVAIFAKVATRLMDLHRRAWVIGPPHVRPQVLFAYIAFFGGAAFPVVRFGSGC